MALKGAKQKLSSDDNNNKNNNSNISSTNATATNGSMSDDDLEKSSKVCFLCFRGDTERVPRPKVQSRGESLQCLAYEVSYFSKGFLPKAYEISDFL